MLLKVSSHLRQLILIFEKVLDQTELLDPESR